MAPTQIKGIFPSGGTACQDMPSPPDAHEEPFRGSGEIRALLRSVDWSKTPLGAVASWPKSLIGFVHMILEMPTPAIIIWGPEQTQLYNEGYAAIMGPLHPKYFGAPGADCWPDTYAAIEPLMRKVFAGEVVTFDKTYFPVVRSGFTEEAYFTFTFSPIRDDACEIAGIFQPVREETESVLAKRRAETLHELAQVPGAAEAIAILSSGAKDVPFAAIYFWNDAEKRLEVAAASDGLRGHDCAALHAAAREAFDTGACVRIDDFGFAPAGPWGDPTPSAFVVPLGQPTRGVAIFGISPRLHFDEAYRRFLESAAATFDRAGERAILIAREVATHLERRRAENEQRFLSEVGAILASSLDYEETLTSVERLAVRDFADICIVDLVEESGETRRLRTVSRDPALDWACAILTTVPFDRTRPHLLRPALEATEPVLRESLSSEDIALFAQNEERLRALRAIDPKSVIVVPLLAREQIVGVIGFVSSTPSRRYSSQDLQLAEALARRAALAIENARLYRAAHRAIQVRDDVLGIVAHDLRSPLNSILMQTQLMQRRGRESERRSQKPVDMIRRSASRMNRMIQDLLDVARIEAGSLTVERARVSVGQVLADIVDVQKPLASEASLDLRLDVARDVVEVWADRDRLHQIFENLIGNAVKFTSAGGSITVGAAPRDGEVLFCVTDTGTGISAENLPHVFDRFWQARKGERRGAGLGLHIVKGLVEAHGGRIWVESTPGRGSTFFFTIPTAPRAEDWRPEPAPHGA